MWVLYTNSTSKQKYLYKYIYIKLKNYFQQKKKKKKKKVNMPTFMQKKKDKVSEKIIVYHGNQPLLRKVWRDTVTMMVRLFC